MWPLKSDLYVALTASYKTNYHFVAAIQRLYGVGECQQLSMLSESRWETSKTKL